MDLSMALENDSKKSSALPVEASEKRGRSNTNFCCRSPRDPTQRLIKRVVAVEGDTIRTLGYRERLVTVPRGHCWLEGDNHAHSLDSNRFGPVALGLLVARASHRVWPPRRWGRLKSRPPEPGRLLMTR
ncbi:hypothetical protein HPB51_012594 [Rhipicephalus microplus]|uniref:Mitochondrial inner membrane protease subunit 2 n=1 Tax=Rhipicephalus microplus TaxID=6941 RepID=A0A9J6E1V6_RHIMP|nr:hypothetical protein HPB51_012594 [Rhipicephalus microplus]